MDTTVEILDSSSSVVIVDDSVDSEESLKKTCKRELNETVDLVSSSESSDTESSEASNNTSINVEIKAQPQVEDETGFVTAAEFASDSNVENDSEATTNCQVDKAAFQTPSAASFMGSVSSTSTPVVKFPHAEVEVEEEDKIEDETTQKVDTMPEVGARQEVDTTQEVDTIQENEAPNDITISEPNLCWAQASEVQDEVLSSPNLTINGDKHSDIQTTRTLVEESDKEVAQTETDESDTSTTDSSDESSLGATSDVEGNLESRMISLSLPSKRRRIMDPDLPSTCTVLHSKKYGGKVYLVGTAHFSRESQEDVSRVIRAVQPDAVVLELCEARVNILHTDEAKIQEEAQNLTFEKMLATIRQNGVVQGTMYFFLLYFSAKLTKELGMAPGGEFRRAYLEAKQVPGCIVQLGDRRIEVTMKRAFSTLSFWQKLKFGYSILTHKDTITPEEVEQCKQKDLLESMLEEIAGEFPALSKVFVQERDLYLANSLRTAVDCPPQLFPQPSGAHNEAYEPRVVVGVVGIGHVSGIVSNWEKVKPEEVAKLMAVPKSSRFSRIAFTAVRLSVAGLGLYACYRVARLPVNFIKSRIF